MSQSPSQIPAGLFAMGSEKIVEFLGSPEKFPDGPAAGLRVLAFYLSYAGRRLAPSQLRRLERAKKLLTQHIDQVFKQQQRKAA